MADGLSFSHILSDNLCNHLLIYEDNRCKKSFFLKSCLLLFFEIGPFFTVAQAVLELKTPSCHSLLRADVAGMSYV